MPSMPTTIDWLLAGPPFVEVQARLGLLGEGGSPAVREAHRRMIASPEVRAIVQELQAWPVAPLNGHKSAGHPIHKLTFLADLGLTRGDPGIDRIARRVMAHASPDGPFQVVMNIQPAYGGTGKDTWAWALCDAPLLVYALLRFGYQDEPAVQRALDALTRLVRENGWPCAVSSELGGWRGPGRKDDRCPFANLAMLKALSDSSNRDEHAARLGTEAILSQWERRRQDHAYMFYMGTDFCKPKAPLVWYDVLHVLNVLTAFPWTRGDPRLLEMARHLDAWFDDGRTDHASLGVEGLGRLGVCPEERAVTLGDAAGADGSGARGTGNYHLTHGAGTCQVVSGITRDSSPAKAAMPPTKRGARAASEEGL